MKPQGKIKRSAVTLIIWAMVIISFFLTMLLSATHVWTSHADEIVAGPKIETPMSRREILKHNQVSTVAAPEEQLVPPYPESLQVLSPTPPPSKRPKLLLGIVSHGFQYKRNKQRRRVIRHTYLKYAETLSGTKICRKDEVIANPEILENCDVVYAFILVEALHSQYASKEVQADFRKYEPDSIYLPPKIQDDSVILSEWIKWCHNFFGTAEHPFLLDKMHYVGLISAQVNIYPTSFWKKNELFKKYSPSTFAGIPVGETNRQYEDDFLCFSRDLVGYLKEAPPRPNKVPPPEGEGEEVAEVGTFARRVSKHLKEKVKEEDGRKINRFGIRGLPFCGAMAFPSLEYWDQYMERVFKYKDKQEESLIRTAHNNTIPNFHGLPRFLMGIFTTNTSDLETERRKVIRETYLQSYANSETPHRICSLQQLLKKEIKQSDCQVAYTFVMGANETAQYTLPMSTPLEGLTVEGSEPDAVYLNIRENMEDGKTETYFHWVELLSKVLYFDYVGKMDTDTLLYTDTFFEETKHWPTFPDNARVYAGQLAIKGDGIIPIGPLPLNGINYMYGRIYMMSPDLARFVSSDKCDRKRWGTQSEDISMGNYVHSHPLPIHLKRLSKFCIVHPVKEPEEFRATWERPVRFPELFGG